MHAAHEVLADTGGVDVLDQLPVEPFHIEAKLLCVRVECPVIEALLVLVENIVHFPELALDRCRFRRFGGLLRMRMRGRDREVAKDEAKRLTHSLLDLLDYWIGGAAIRTLVVPVLDERDRSVGRAIDVVAALRHRHRQRGCPLRGAHDPSPLPRLSSARRMPSAPGLTPTGET